ncbi:MAG TPA: hypothetical protein VFK08_09285 [Rhodanobacteraceae bacterium]|jgi:hypothetical protein|nr:hypothetical protein [Rhodanobacteraceae bacterium]
MQDWLATWVLPVLFGIVGIALLFVRIECGEPDRVARIIPGFALFRFAAFRYVMALVLIVFGLFVHFVSE